MELAIWSGFIVLICAILALDLGVLNKKDHVIGFREALRWTALWVAVSMSFLGVVYYLYDNHVAGFGGGDVPLDGPTAALLYVTAYLVEYSLSIDNIFVIALIIAAFRVPRLYQHRVLFWGILGALVLRGAMIGAGAALLKQFTWMIYVFGGILILSAIKMAMAKDDGDFDPNDSAVVRFAKRFYPMAPTLHGNDFFVFLADGRRAMTPLFLVLLLIESTDVLFAVDSIPAVFAVTTDPFLVFTSNIFAIMGLRSLYFALAGMLGKFHHLKHALVVLMAFIGIKMLASHHFSISPGASLAVIALILAAGVIASLAWPLSAEELAKHDARHAGHPHLAVDAIAESAESAEGGHSADPAVTATEQAGAATEQAGAATEQAGAATEQAGADSPPAS